MINLTNQNRFDILRGYKDKLGMFHSGGEANGISMETLMHKLEFNNLNDFQTWFNHLAQDEIENGKKDWCSGKDCQSILSELLKIDKK